MYSKYEDVLRVNLVSYTQCPIEDDDKSIYDLIAYCARVSNPANQSNHDTAEKLIAYLIKHKHWSPFEQANICLEVVSTRDIVRQILRHRSFSFMEFSQRYADPSTMGDSFVIRECRMQDNKNRQNSLECSDGPLAQDWALVQDALINKSRSAYEWAIKNGIAKEVARSVLPEGNTVSRVYINGTIRSWLHFLDVRTGPETQKEHRLVAHACAEAIAKIFPMIKEFCHE
jgi:thymidylate synthase (FAD)